MFVLAILSQIALIIWFVLTHWIPLPPLNDLTHEDFRGKRMSNALFLLFQGLILIGFMFAMAWLIWFGALFYTLWLAGHICSWWLPYLFGWPRSFLKAEQRKTLSFLPPIGHHPIPDLNHCVLGLLSLIVFISVWLSVI